MAKVIISTLTTLIGNESSAVAAINTNFENIRNEFDNVLSLDGTTPSSLSADLDFDSNDLLNGGEGNFVSLDVSGDVVVDGTLTVDGTDLDSVFTATVAAKDAAVAAQAAAETAQSNAETSEANAAASETAAESAASQALANSENPAMGYNYDNTTSQPGLSSGQMRFNNLDLSSATEAYIHDTDVEGNDMAAEIASWDDEGSGNRGKLYITEVDGSSLVVFRVTGATTDNGTDSTLTITYVSGATSFTDGNTLSVLHAPPGTASQVVDDTSPQLGGDLDGQGFDLDNMGVLFLTEQAAAEADVAGKGQWWVQTATPNLPMFTNDVGTDFQLASIAGTETLTNKTLTSPTINSPALSSDSVDTITEIASSLKSGTDGTLVTGTAGTNGNVTIWNGDGDLVDSGSSIADLTQTDEEIQDLVGAMFSGNTETLITATYEDGDGTIDLVVDNDLANYDNTNSDFATVSGIETLTNKTIDLTDNTLSGTTAEFDTALESDTFVFTSEVGSVVLAQQTIGIADDNLLEVDGSPNATEYARFTANGLEGRTEAEFKADFNLEIGTDVQAFDADTLKTDVGDTLTAGFLTDSFSGGTQSSGTYTPAPGTGEENFQHIVNGGAFTLAPPANPCNVVLEITNNASAGTITTSGFTQVSGDSFTTTDGHDFLCFITRSQNFSHLNVVALQ